MPRCPRCPLFGRYQEESGHSADSFSGAASVLELALSDGSHFHGRRSLWVRSGHGRTRCPLDPVAHDPERTYIAASVAAASPRSAGRPSSAHSSGSPALRKPSITIDGVGVSVSKPFDCELRVETTRLRQSQFRLGVVPFRGLSSSQHRSRKNRSGIPRKWHA